ncbi:hypothetical protein [Chitinimonas sp.]|uniref:hypothetical protein n=1 Tax=Chitinimonas sp. TaxID=1934313 RepID=UPI002F94D76A
MFRSCLLLTLLLAVPALAGTQGGPMPGSGGAGGGLRPPPRAMQREALAAERFQHREARIRDALERGDLTPGEANQLRQRLEARRERLERWREQRQREGRPDVQPGLPPP